MAVVTAIAVGAVAAGGAILAAQQEKGAAKKAAGIQARALDGVEYLDIDKLNDKALGADSKKFEEQFKLQEKFDPTVANLRKEGASGILEGLNDDPAANDLLNQLAQEGQTDSPKRKILIDKLMESAEAEINAGATLPPEFQQELVRSGLESSGSAGITGSGTAGVQARTLLGKAGLELQAHRRSQATDLLSTADALKQNRAAILANTLGAVEAAKSQRQGRFINAYGIGAAGVPNAGLSGADVVNLDIANTDMKNQVTLGKGNIYANLALAKGAANSKMIGGLTSAATGMIGGVAGGMGGGMGGGAGGIMGGWGGGGAAGGVQAQQPTQMMAFNTYARPSAYGRGGYIV